MPHLTPENTNSVAHRVAGDLLVYECPRCEYGEVPIAGLIEDDTAGCLDCGARFELLVEEAEVETET